MTLLRLKTTFRNKSGIMISSRSSGYNARIIENAARVNNSYGITSTAGVSARRTATTSTRVAISGPAAPTAFTPIQLTPSAVGQLLPTIPVPSAIRPETITADISDQVTITPSSTVVWLPPTITLAPLATPDERGFFPPVESGPTDFIHDPNDESFSGPALTDDEKQKILAISALEVINGKPSKVVVFFKPFLSPSKKAIKYILKRKALFDGSRNIVVATLTPEQLVSAKNFPEIVNAEAIDPRGVYGIVDSSFTANSVYVYRLYAEWINRSPEDQAAFVTTSPSEDVLNLAGSLFRTA